MSPDAERTLRIVDALNRLTVDREVSWSEVGDCIFATSVAGQQAVVSSDDRDNVAPFTFVIENNEGLIIQRLRSIGSGELTPAQRTDANRVNLALYELYRLARDRALGISDALGRIEDALGIDPPDKDVS